MKVLAGRRPSPAFLIGCLALLVALAGQANALPGTNSVVSNDIAPGAVKRSDVAANAINGGKVSDASLSAADLAGGIAPSGPAGGDLAGTYPDPRIAENAIGSGQIINGAVRAPDIGRITVVESTSPPFVQGSLGSAFVVCPTGTQVMNGGGQTSGGLSILTLSRRSGDNGWRVDAFGYGPDPSTVTALAYCLEAAS